MSSRSASNEKTRPVADYSERPKLPAGLVEARQLPDPEFTELWDAILVPDEIKDRLLAQAVLNFTLRAKVSRSILPLHGVILLVGPPGTGKTSLAKGLATRTAEALRDRAAASFRFVEVDPHVLSSGSLGKTQRAVTDLFVSSIAEQAALGPLVVLLDEVETILGDRARMSLEANPIDVHRATDAALVQLDRLAATHPGVLFVATSNFPRAIDAAFLSRADVIITVPLPDETGRLEILRNTLEGMSSSFPKLRELAQNRDLAKVARAAEGLDGRAMRKLVVAACARDKKIALDPELLTLAQLLEAARASAHEIRSVSADTDRRAPVPARVG